MTPFRWWAAFVPSLVIVAAVRANAATMADCAAVVDAGERLACYDALARESGYRPGGAEEPEGSLLEAEEFHALA